MIHLGGLNLEPSLNVPILSSVAGFEKPSRIQQRAIKPMIKGRDVIAQCVKTQFIAILKLLFTIRFC